MHPSKILPVFPFTFVTETGIVVVATTSYGAFVPKSAQCYDALFFIECHSLIVD
jgi:hypothetical protein